ncbi:MAG: ATP-binding protein [Bdellovibrionaceae bacterium]|nr:ATP-binding protein [Pseudobdellovibrionaceae bacterium]
MTATAKRIIERLPELQDYDGSLSQLPQWNHRILIVEDETAIADAYKDILGSSGNVTSLRRSSRSPGGGAPPAGADPGASTAMHSTAGSQSPPAEAAKLPTRFELTVVHSAEQALAEIKHAVKQKRPFTMGFFDVLLGGGMDGIELVKQIHEIDPDLYAVFVTAYSDRSVDSIQTFLGADHAARWDYLNKPFTQGEILQKARAGVSVWNLRREKQISEDRLSHMQKALLENERFASAAAVARGIGHEFRNILTLITGKAELGQRAGTDQMKEAFKQILLGADRAEEILQRFNFLYNPGDQKIAKKIFHAHQPLDEALLMMKHQLAKEGIKVCWIRKKPVILHANSTALLQVFVNLLINATHAMTGSGQIDLSVQEVDGQCEIRIRDYGTGIDPEILPRVTEPFFTTKGEKGTGLGLAIAKEIIENEHDGVLTLSNHEIKGLEVIIQLPIHSETASDGGQNQGG